VHKHKVLALGFACATCAAFIGRRDVGQWHAGEILVSASSQVVGADLLCATGCLSTAHTAGRIRVPVLFLKVLFQITFVGAVHVHKVVTIGVE